jgi:Derlin-2/3
MSALVQCQMVTPFQLFYSFRAVFVKSQVSTVFGMFLFPLLMIHLCWGDLC